MDGDDLIKATRFLKRQKSQLEVIKRLHESCGHRSVKRLINLKRLGRIKEADLPNHFLREFKKQCPTCLTTYRKRKALSGVAADIKENQELSKWEMVYMDSSGRSAVCEKGWCLAKSACQ